MDDLAAELRSDLRRQPTTAASLNALRVRASCRFDRQPNHHVVHPVRGIQSTEQTHSFFPVHDHPLEFESLCGCVHTTAHRDRPRARPVTFEGDRHESPTPLG